MKTYCIQLKAIVFYFLPPMPCMKHTCIHIFTSVQSTPNANMVAINF